MRYDAFGTGSIIGHCLKIYLTFSTFQKSTNLQKSSLTRFSVLKRSQILQRPYTTTGGVIAERGLLVTLCLLKISSSSFCNSASISSLTWTIYIYDPQSVSTVPTQSACSRQCGVHVFLQCRGCWRASHINPWPVEKSHW